MCSLHISLHIWHLYLIQFVLILLLNSLSSLSKNTRIVDRFYYSNCGTFELLKDNSNERHLVFHLTCHFYMQEILKWFYVKIPHKPFYIYIYIHYRAESSHTSWNLTLVLCVIDLSCCSARQQSPLDSKTLLLFARQQISAPFCCTVNSALLVAALDSKTLLLFAAQQTLLLVAAQQNTWRSKLCCFT